jgi:hypothetical protein
VAVDDPADSSVVWHDIPSLPGYQLSDDLRVRSSRRCGWKTRAGGWHLLAVRVAGPGYAMFNARVDGRRKPAYLHRAVAEVKYGRRLRRGEIVRHLDDDRLNNSPDNIVIGDQKQNVDDYVRNGRNKTMGRRVPFCVAVAVARDAVGTEMRQNAIADKWGVTTATVSQIVRGDHWSRIGRSPLRAIGDGGRATKRGVAVPPPQGELGLPSRGRRST